MSTKTQVKPQERTLEEPGGQIASTKTFDWSAPASTVPYEEKFVGTPYVAFRGATTGKNTEGLKEALDSAGVKEFTFYLKDELGVRPLSPFQYHLLSFHRLWTKCNQQGQVVAAVNDTAAIPKGDDKFREAFYAVILVAIGGKLIPATATFRSGLAGAIRIPVKNLSSGGLALNPEAWAARGSAYVLSAKCNVPCARFITTAWGSTEETADGENEYNKGSCSVSPSQVPELERFAAFQNDPKTGKQIAAAVDYNSKRVNDLLNPKKG